MAKATIKDDNKFQVNLERIKLPSLTNPAVIGLGVIVLLAAIITISSIVKVDNNSTQVTEEKEQVMLALPAGWQKITKEGYENTFVKTQDSKEAYTPTVAYDENAITPSEPEEFLKRIIDGAKTAIPSLTVENTTINKFDGYEVMTLSGNYWDNSANIQISQRLLMKDSTLHTIAASYEEGQDVNEAELDAVFDYIVQTTVLQ